MRRARASERPIARRAYEARQDPGSDGRIDARGGGVVGTRVRPRRRRAGPRSACSARPRRMPWPGADAVEAQVTRGPGGRGVPGGRRQAPGGSRDSSASSRTCGTARPPPRSSRPPSAQKADLIVMSHARPERSRAPRSSAAWPSRCCAARPRRSSSFVPTSAPLGSPARRASGGRELPMYRRALVPLDGSMVAEAIVPFILEIAGPLDMQVALAPRRRAGAAARRRGSAHVSSTTSRKLARRRPRRTWRRSAGELRARGVRVTDHGAPAASRSDEILAAARDVETRT